MPPPATAQKARTGQKPKTNPRSRKPTSCEVGFARAPFYGGFRLGEISTVNNRQNLVIESYGLGGYFVKPKKMVLFSTV
jgi:hypothetical protein